MTVRWFAKDNLPGTMLKYYDSSISMLIEASLMLHSRASSQQVPCWQTWQADLRLSFSFQSGMFRLS